MKERAETVFDNLHNLLFILVPPPMLVIWLGGRNFIFYDHENSFKRP